MGACYLGWILSNPANRHPSIPENRISVISESVSWVVSILVLFFSRISKPAAVTRRCLRKDVGAKGCANQRWVVLATETCGVMWFFGYLIGGLKWSEAIWHKMIVNFKIIPKRMEHKACLKPLIRYGWWKVQVTLIWDIKLEPNWLMTTILSFCVTLGAAALRMLPEGNNGLKVVPKVFIQRLQEWYPSYQTLADFRPWCWAIPLGRCWAPRARRCPWWLERMHLVGWRW